MPIYPVRVEDAAPSGGRGDHAPLRFEPNADEELEALLPLHARARIQKCSCMPRHSDLASRQQAMHSATDTRRTSSATKPAWPTPRARAEITRDLRDSVRCRRPGIKLVRVKKSMTAVDTEAARRFRTGAVWTRVIGRSSTSCSRRTRSPAVYKRSHANRPDRAGEGESVVEMTLEVAQPPRRQPRAGLFFALKPTDGWSAGRGWWTLRSISVPWAT